MASTAGSRSSSRGGTILRWFLRLLILAAILLGLWLLNGYLGLDRFVRAPRPFLRQVWLPLLFLLFYLLCWLGWSLWKLVGPDQLTSEFPDIDQAWDEAVEALVQGGIELTEAPLFLILGHPRGGEKSLFGAANLKLLVKQVPRETECPISVSANQEGIYVSCTGASLLGQQSIFLSIGPDRSSATEEAPPRETSDGDWPPTEESTSLLDGGVIQIESPGFRGQPAGRDGDRAGHLGRLIVDDRGNEPDLDSQGCRRGRANPGPPPASLQADRSHATALLSDQRHPRPDPPLGNQQQPGRQGHRDA